MSLLKLSDISKTYKSGQLQTKVLRGIDISIEDGEFVSIMGPSGSGKSTLLNIIGCLDLPTSGKYEIRDISIGKLSDSRLSSIRNEFIGFVFQNFHLLTNLTAIENVELPLIYRGIIGKERKILARSALKSVGLDHRINHLPTQLSGGEQQRVAIARALASKPSVILADEPTGALDSHSSENIMNIFNKLNQELGITIVQVTHSRETALYSNKIYHMLDGKIEKLENVEAK